MEDTNKKIKSFTDLIVWQKAHQLVLDVYKVTREFPKEEMFVLTSQIRRAVVSISSNIAEGFSRRSYPDKIHFYTMSSGSITELQNQLLIARDLDYLNTGQHSKLNDLTIEVHKLLNGLIRQSKTKL
ncbi:MAG: four helix bundle protein [Candidatus Berkelbacteria bacterium]|nr:four helix bundle protein [Candidatus Berkelbacteria bacterium]